MFLGNFTYELLFRQKYWAGERQLWENWQWECFSENLFISSFMISQERLKMANRISIDLSSGLWPWRTKIIHNIKWYWCMSSAKSAINLYFKPKMKTRLWPLSENDTNRNYSKNLNVSCTDSENTWSPIDHVRRKVKCKFVA